MTHTFCGVKASSFLKSYPYQYLLDTLKVFYRQYGVCVYLGIGIQPPPDTQPLKYAMSPCPAQLARCLKGAHGPFGW